MTTAREDTTRLADLLRREHHAMADFVVALSTFDRDRRWEELGYASLFDFLRRVLKLSAGAAQYRKTGAELVRRFPVVEAALRRGDLCLSSVAQLAKVLTAENAAEVLPLFFGKSSRDAEFVAASVRPVENSPRRGFIVTPVRANPNFGPGGGVTRSAFRAREMPVGAGATVEPAALAAAFAAPPPATTPGLPSLSPSLAASASLSPRLEPLRIRPLDAERARVNMTPDHSLSRNHPPRSIGRRRKAGAGRARLPPPLPSCGRAGTAPARGAWEGPTGPPRPLIAPPSRSHAGSSPLAPAATSRRVNTETAWQPAVWRAPSVRARARWVTPSRRGPRVRAPGALRSASPAPAPIHGGSPAWTA